MSNSEEAPLNMANLAASLPNSDQALNSGNTGPCDDLKILTPQQASLWNSLSPKVRKKVLILREIQKQHDEFEAKFREEKAALEARYQKLYEPLYSKRYDIVNGHMEVDVTDGAAEENKEDGVPEFWLNAMKTNEVLALQITERDEGALKYLKDIRSSKTDSPKGFKLDFYFASNPYFKNAVLTKTYQMVEEDDDDEPILERAIGTVIEWYPGKNLTQKVLKKKTAKGAKNSKPITKTEKCESFFNFFDPPEVPDDDDEIDDDVAEQLQETLEEDYDIGSTIRDKIIPHAVSWFTGEALQGEDLEDGDDDSEDDEEDDEGEEDEDDDDDDDDEEDGKKVTGRKPSASLTKPGQKVSMAQPAECKQQ